MNLYFITEEIDNLSNENIGEIVRRMNQYLRKEELTPISKQGELLWRQLMVLHGKQLRDNRRYYNKKNKTRKEN